MSEQTFHSHRLRCRSCEARTWLCSPRPKEGYAINHYSHCALVPRSPMIPETSRERQIRQALAAEVVEAEPVEQG